MAILRNFSNKIDEVTVAMAFCAICVGIAAYSFF